MVNKNFVAVLILSLAVFASYANTFKNEFVWDDIYFIVENIHIRQVSNIPEFFLEPSAGDLYRPVRSVFYTIAYNLFGLSPFGYHLNGILLHLAVTLTLYFITLKITEKKLLSFSASLFFAAHPIHTERVTNMTGGFDIYGIVFLLLALFFYISFSKNSQKKYFILSSVFYLLALFSSEEAITFIALLFLYDFSFNYDINFNNFKLLLKRHVPYILATVFYLITRFLVVEKIGRAEIYFNESFFGTFLTTLKIFAEYILILFFPINLVTERYAQFEPSILSLGVIFSLIAFLILSFFFIRSYAKSKTAFFSIGWFFITLMPFSNLLPQYTIMAERYLYLPSYGFCLFLAFAIFSIENLKTMKLALVRDFFGRYSKSIIGFVVLFLTLSYIALTIQRNAEWKDDFTLLSKTIERNPFATRTYQALALYYRDQGDYLKAAEYASKAIELSSKNHHAYENLGTISAYNKDYEQAIYYYKKSLEISPNFYLALNNLGLVYSYTGDFNNSIHYLNFAIQSNPKLAKAYNDLGAVYGQTGNFDEAIEYIRKAIEINPYEPSYYRNLAVIYNRLGNIEEAERLFQMALETESSNQGIGPIKSN